MSDAPLPLPAFTSWPTFPFEGDLRVKKLADPVDEEPPRHGEDPAECSACRAPDSAYIWISERWRVRALDRPTGLPMVLILESRSHLDMGDLTNLLAAELGVLTVRLERAIRSLDGVARVHVNRWGDGSAHLHVWFLARPAGRLQLRGTFLSLWDDILPRIPEFQWRENLALVAAWLADFGGEALAEPPHIDWQSPAELNLPSGAAVEDAEPTAPVSDSDDAVEAGGLGSSVVAAETSELTRELKTPDAPANDGVTTVAVSRETDRTSNLADVSGGETVRIPTARGTGGETVNLGEIGGEKTVALRAAGDGDRAGGVTADPAADATDHSAGDGGATTNRPASDGGDTARRSTPGGDTVGRSTTGGDTVNLAAVGGNDAVPVPGGNGTDNGTDEPDGSATMRFGTSGVTGSGAQTMVFPTGDAMAAARAEAERDATSTG